MLLTQCLRFFLLTIALSSLPLVTGGCGGGGSAEAGKSLPPSEDPTLDPKNDSTMQPQGGSNAPAITQ